MHALCTQKKNYLGDRPTYHFHFNLHFLKAPLAQCLSQAPCHSATRYASACAPQVIIYFRCLLDLLLDFRFGACCFSAVDVDELATAATNTIFPLFAYLACPWGCLAVFLYTFLCPCKAKSSGKLQFRNHQQPAAPPPHHQNNWGSIVSIHAMSSIQFTNSTQNKNIATCMLVMKSTSSLAESTPSPNRPCVIHQRQ